MSRYVFAATLALSLGAVLIGHGAGRPAAQTPGPGSTTLDDQVDLGVTVYNSDIALVRDVRDMQLPRGSSDLRFMDIAATVNPATVHFRSLTDPSKSQRARAELRIRPARSREAPAQVRRTRRDGDPYAPGRRARRGRGGEGAAPQLQRRAGLADWQRDRDGHAGVTSSAFRNSRRASTRGRR